MGLYRAESIALSTTTAVGPGVSYTAGTAANMIQLALPDQMTIYVVEFGVSFAVTPATFAIVELATTDTASTTSLTAHSATTVKPYSDLSAGPSGVLYGTSATSYGTAASTITSNTTLRTLHKAYAGQVYKHYFEKDARPLVGQAAAENFLQLRINVGVTGVAYGYIIWSE